MTTNGHDVAAIDSGNAVGSTVEIDPKKLGIEGNRLLGQAEALDRWVAMFNAYAQRSLDLRERQVLREVVKALGADADQVKMALAGFASKRGAAKITPADDGGDE